MPQPKRIFRPLAEAQAYVRTLGLAKQKDYETWSKSGARPDDIPGNPVRAYAPHWPGWAEFLGNGGARPNRISKAEALLPFEEARAVVRRLGLRSQHDYMEWCKTADRPANIPSNPYKVYAEAWTDWSDWLGLSGADGYRPFEAARHYAIALGLKSRNDWAAHARRPHGGAAR